MRSFAAAPRDLVGDAEGMRPLLCDGHPLTCTVAVIGANPRTATPFWQFWDDEYGMNRKGWIEAYRARHDGTYGRSRAAIERIVPKVAGRVIELSAYAARSDRVNDLNRTLRNSDVLDYILGAVPPKVIVCAGRDALTAVNRMSLPWSPRRLEARHFIYWGTESEDRLAEEVNKLL